MNFNDAVQMQQGASQRGDRDLLKLVVQTRTALNQLIEQASRDIKTLADAVTALQKGMLVLQRENVAIKAQLLSAVSRPAAMGGIQAVRAQAARPQEIELNSPRAPNAPQVVNSTAWTQGSSAGVEEDAEVTSSDDAFYAGGE